MRQVLLAIAETAFVASPYPVVLSLEMHCSLPQQESTLPSYHPMPLPRDALLAAAAGESALPSYHPTPLPRDALLTYFTNEWNHLSANLITALTGDHLTLTLTLTPTLPLTLDRRSWRR